MDLQERVHTLFGARAPGELFQAFENAGHAWAELSVAQGHQRIFVRTETQGLGLVAQQRHAAGFVPIVVFRGHPEDGNSWFSLRFQRLGITHGADHFRQAEQRPTENARLLPRDHHMGLGICQLVRQLLGPGHTVA